MAGEDSTVPAVAVAHLTHRYAAAMDRAALDDVSFDVQTGEIFGILGPNGGGKTTLFRILATLLKQTAGSIRVLGHDTAAAPAAVRGLLGVVFQNPSLDTKLTARENMRHHGRLYGIARGQLNQRIDHWLERFDMIDRADERVEHFSGGMRRRVELAKAMLPQPRLLLLDEPATGLDPGARRDMWQQMRALRSDGGVTVVLTTHLMDEADGCDRLAILSRGNHVAVDTPEALKSRIGGDVITVAPSGDPQPLRETICNRFAPFAPGGEPVVVDGLIRFEKTDGAGAVGSLHSELGDAVRSVTVGRPTLEDVFLHLTGHTLYDDAPTRPIAASPTGGVRRGHGARPSDAPAKSTIIGADHQSGGGSNAGPEQGNRNDT